MPTQDSAPPVETAADPLAGRRLGRYRLIQRLGEGGMGAVYLAEQEGEIRRRVAVKVVRQQLANPEVLARFHRERQTMAALSHPNIVTLLDCGATEDGAPYLVMEYVEGARIDEYCREQRVPLHDLLRLFLEVCAAVQHAHRSLVVHCDLKPANILVTSAGVPKLLDFGIAKLLQAQPLDFTGQVTRAGQRPFTPDFASPEQLRGEPVTTATDVYALGVVLYLLLTGESPHRTRTGSAAELIQAICVAEPHRPSTLVPQDHPEKLRRRLEGDLDAILLKALRKEPQSRYGSVEQLADDLRRHLEGRPVAARRGTFRYRAIKFVQRNRLAVAAAALAALAVVGGTIGIAWQGSLALAAGARAERRFQDVRRLTNFLLFDFHDAVQKLPGSTPVQEMLVTRALGYLDGLAAEAAGERGLQLELVEAYVKFGDVQGNPYQANLGDTSGAMTSYRKALAIAEPLARSDPSNIGAQRALARVVSHMGDVLYLTRKLTEATAHSRRAAAILEKLVAEQPRDLELRADLAGALEGLGDQLARGLSDAAGAMQTYRRALDHWEAAVRLDTQNLRARRASAGLRMKIGDLQFTTDPRAALATLRQALAIVEALPVAERGAVPTRRLEGALRRRIGDGLWELEDAKGALESYRRAAEDFAALAALDPTNSRAQFDLVTVLNDTGQTLEASGDVAGALRNYGQVADILEKLVKTDPTNPSWRAHLAEILVRIGVLLEKTGQAAEARHQAVRGLQAARELAERPETPASELTRAARLLVTCQPADLRDPDAAVRYGQRAVLLTRGADAYALDTLAEAYLQNGKPDAARQAVAQGLALVPETGGQKPWLRRLLEAKLERLDAAAGKNRVRR
jgi:tetratricopeptide (TPR) repeat protein